MPTRKPRIVIIGAGMAGLTAANKLYKSAGSKDLFELSVLEGGSRIGGRINTKEFCGDRIEMGATWIHGIKGSPIHQIAQEINSMESEQPWECMDGLPNKPVTIAEGGYELNPSIVEPVSTLFKNLTDFAEGKVVEVESGNDEKVNYAKLAAKSCGPGNISVGSFLRKGLDAYWDSMDHQDADKVVGDWSERALEEAIFAMHENTQRTYTSAGDLHNLDYKAESEYIMFPGEEVTIAKGYLSIIESLSSVLPAGFIQLGRKVTKIEWHPDGHFPIAVENGNDFRPVKLHFLDGSTMSADHVIVTVSLGVLKQGIREDVGLFNPPLPSFKTDAISKLGYGVVNKLFLQLSPLYDQEGKNYTKFPNLQMVFHQSEDHSKLRHPNIPWWMRRTASLSPIYSKSSVLLSWFAGEEALELESLSDEDVLNGVSTTISNFLSKSTVYHVKSYGNQECNGDANSAENSKIRFLKFAKILKSGWGNDPLFLGSYSYVAVGSSVDDMDTLAEPLPKLSNSWNPNSPLQILFAGEATHRTHYSTTHGAYFSGIREANRLLQYYSCCDI